MLVAIDKEVSELRRANSLSLKVSQVGCVLSLVQTFEIARLSSSILYSRDVNS